MSYINQKAQELLKICTLHEYRNVMDKLPTYYFAEFMNFEEFAKKLKKIKILQEDPYYSEKEGKIILHFGNVVIIIMCPEMAFHELTDAKLDELAILFIEKNRQQKKLCTYHYIKLGNSFPILVYQ